MPMFFGCMSSKQAKSPEKSVKSRPDEPTKEKAKSVQNGGSRTDGQTEDGQAATPATSPHDVSVSQVDVTEDVRTSSGRDTSRDSKVFLSRPATIVREDCLITEIVSALGDKTEVPSANSQGHTEAKQDKRSDSQHAAEAPPSATTPSSPDAPTLTADPSKEPNSSEDAEPRPPTPPPRPKTTFQASTTTTLSEPTGRAEKSHDEPAPSLPPRTVPTDKPPSTTTTRGENSEVEEPPPTLPPRRAVPPSPPRLSAVDSAPPKPRRSSVDSNSEEGLLVRKAKPASFREPPPLPEDWAIIELPKTDAELIRLTSQPEQLATMASQYVIKHISLHTDVRVTTKFSDQIQTAFLEVSKQDGGILRRFLTDLIEEQAVVSGADSQPAEPSHGAVIVVIREILRHFVSVESVVRVSLTVLQAVSRVSGATLALVDCEVTGAVLGTMSAHKSSAAVQCPCLEVLAKIACFPPSVRRKAPLEQLAIDLITLSMESFPKSVTIAGTACDVLSTLVTTLHNAVNCAVENDKGASEDEDRLVSGLLILMDYIFSKSLPVVRSALKFHEQDSTVMSNSRQFFVIYSKLEQLRQRKKQWLSGRSPHLSPPPLPAKRQGREQGHGTPVPARAAEQVLRQVPDPAPRDQVAMCQVGPLSDIQYENWDLLRGVLRKKSPLKGHQYSRADLHFMWHLTKTQVVALVCARAVEYYVQEALQLLDQPVAEIVRTTEVAPGVRDFVDDRCTATQTLIELDAGLFVSLIDAVRYAALSFQMAQRSVLEVAGGLDGEQQMPVVAVAVEFLASTIINRPLAPAMTEPNFVEKLCGELERAKSVSRNNAALHSLLSEIRQCASKTAR